MCINVVVQVEENLICIDVFILVFFVNSVDVERDVFNEKSFKEDIVVVIQVKFIMCKLKFQ